MHSTRCFWCWGKNSDDLEIPTILGCIPVPKPGKKSHRMQVRKAVITAAAPDQHRLPLQQLVDRSGNDKTALQLILEESAAAGIEQIGVVIRPGDEDAYRAAAGSHVGSLRFIQQPEPLGYADAIYQAKSFIGDDPFLHLVGDHLYLSNTRYSLCPPVGRCRTRA